MWRASRGAGGRVEPVDPSRAGRSVAARGATAIEELSRGEKDTGGKDKRERARSAPPGVSQHADDGCDANSFIAACRGCVDPLLYFPVMLSAVADRAHLRHAERRSWRLSRVSGRGQNLHRDACICKLGDETGDALGTRWRCSGPERIGILILGLSGPWRTCRRQE
jgi:hypothetical protein